MRWIAGIEEIAGFFKLMRAFRKRKYFFDLRAIYNVRDLLLFP